MLSSFQHVMMGAASTFLLSIGSVCGATKNGRHDHDHPRQLQTYTSNEGVAIVASINSLDQSGSNQKCIEFTQGPPTEESIEYTKACFTTLYSSNSEFINCAVTIDDATQCDSCTACTMPDGAPGFEVDCFSFHGNSNTDQCVALSDDSIQSVLLDDLFDSQTIEFVDAPTSKSSSLQILLSLLLTLLANAALLVEA